MDLVQAIRTNGSVRSFEPDLVDDAALIRVLDNARFAPSGGNKQGWHVIVVKDVSTRAQIASLARMGWNEYAALNEAGVRPFASDETGRWPGPPQGVDLANERHIDRPWSFIGGLENAPALLVIAVDLRAVAAVDADADRTPIAGGGSIYPFVQNILLAARAEGLAGVMTTFLIRQEPAAQALLGLPKHFAIASVVALGVPTHQNSVLRRRAVAEFATIDRFDGAAFGEL